MTPTAAPPTTDTPAPPAGMLRTSGAIGEAAPESAVHAGNGGTVRTAVAGRTVTVLHLLTPGDGGDGLLRWAELSASPVSRAGRVRHLGLRMGGRGASGVDPAGLPVPVRDLPALELPATDVAMTNAVHRLLKLIGDEGVGLLHAWGPAAGKLASAACEAVRHPTFRIAAGGALPAELRWVAAELPPDAGTPCPVGLAPRVSLETVRLADPAGYPPLDRATGRERLVLPPWVPQAAAISADVRSGPDRAEVMRRLGIPAEAVVAAFVAPLDGWSDLLSAAWGLALVLQVHPRLHVITLSHGPQRSRWRELLSRGGLLPRHQFRPTPAEWRDVLAVADAALDVSPLWRVSAASAAAEAAGVPLLGVDSVAVGGLRTARDGQRVRRSASGRPVPVPAGPDGVGPAREVAGVTLAEPGVPRAIARELHLLLAEQDRAAELGRIAAAAAAARPARDPAGLHLRLADTAGQG